MGSFHNQTSRNCELCPIGFYNDQERQTNCTPCPWGQTTQDPGAKYISQCYSMYQRPCEINFSIDFVCLVLAMTYAM